MKMSIKVTLGLFLLILSVSYSISIAPPYYQYLVPGYLVCDSLVDKSNNTFMLFGKNNLYDSSYVALNGTPHSNDRVVALSDSSGKFFLIVSSFQKQDSLKVGLIRPGEPVIYSNLHSPNEVGYIPVTSNYFISDDDNAVGCSSCGSEPRRSSAIVRYEYYSTDLNINFCPWFYLADIKIEPE